MKAVKALALVGGHVNEELFTRNEYLAAENEILKARITQPIRFNTGGTKASHSFLRVFMTRSVTAMLPLFPTAPYLGLITQRRMNSLKASPKNKGSLSVMMCLGAPYFRMASSRALSTQPAFGLSRGFTDSTFREK